MIIAIPRERKTLEKRVALTPDGAHELVRRGHTVLIETGAGSGSYFSDAEYVAQGCQIVTEQAELWKRADLVVKVKEPHQSEYEFFRPGLTIFAYLHLASMKELSATMVAAKVTGIAYELVQTEDRRLPLLEPMSEVAGKLAVQTGAYYLQAQHGGRGVLLGGVLGVAPAEVVIVGAGIAGRAACEVAIGMGASVSVLDIDHRKLDRLRMEFGSRVKTLYSSNASIAHASESADLLIGAVLIPGAAAPHLITLAMVKRMKKGAVLVDISIDQGGCSETIKTTSLEKPVYDVEGVIHYGVPNIPAQTPRTSTLALTAVTLPYVVKLADEGVTNCLTGCKEMRKALNTYAGKLTNQAVSEAVGIEFCTIEKALA